MREELIAANAASGERSETRRAVLASARFRAIAVPCFLAEPALQTFKFLIPLHLSAVWHLDLKAIAVSAWLPFLAADFDSLAAGLLPTWLMHRGAGMEQSRKITVTLGRYA